MLKNGPVSRLGFPFILLGLLSAALALATGLQAAAPGESAGKDRLSREAGRIMVQTRAASAQNVGQPPLDLAVPAQIETATFALGWFWGPDARFGVLQGVVRTRVGYSGGTQKNPTYHSLGDHTETMQIDYDPARISFEELLALFWESHPPGAPSWSRQYQAAVFYHNAEQKRLALETKARVAAKIKGEVFTQLLPATEFYLAEDYHQKYYLRRQPELLQELTGVYPTAADLIASTAAARLNGYAAGYGTRAELLREIDGLGLSPAGRKRLLASIPAAGSPPAQGCPVGR